MAILCELETIGEATVGVLRDNPIQSSPFIEVSPRLQKMEGIRLGSSCELLTSELEHISSSLKSGAHCEWPVDTVESTSFQLPRNNWPLLGGEKIPFHPNAFSLPLGIASFLSTDFFP